MPSADRTRFGPIGTGAVRKRPPERPVDGAGMTEVIAHQPLDALPGRVARVAQAFGRDLLQLVAEDVVVALGFEMEDRAHAQQELLGVVERSRIARQHG